MKIDNFIEGSLREEQQNQNISELEYDIIFNKIESEVLDYKEHIIDIRVSKIKTMVNKLKKYFTFKELVSVAAFVLLLIVVPALANNYNKNQKVKIDNIKPIDIIDNTADDKGLTKVPYGYSDRVIIIETPLYAEADSTSRQIKKLEVGTGVMIEDAVKDKGGNIWYKVVLPTDSSNGNRGWIRDVYCKNALASIPAKGNSISNEEIKKLTEEYLEYLQLDRIALDKRIVEYKISEVKMTTIYGGDLTFFAKYDVKPFDTEKYSLPEGKEYKDGWVKDLKSTATVIKVKDMYVLINMETDITPVLSKVYSENYNIAIDILAKKGFIMNQNSGYGGMIELPDNFSSISANKEALGLYFAYCAEISKAQGYDMSKYKGKKVQLIAGSVVKNDSLDKNCDFAVLFFEDKVCGAWIEVPDCATVGKRIQTLEGRSFDDIVKNKNQWYIENGFSDWESLDNILLNKANTGKGQLIYYCN